jgi:hypothetical protein
MKIGKKERQEILSLISLFPVVLYQKAGSTAPNP